MKHCSPKILTWATALSFLAAGVCLAPYDCRASESGDPGKNDAPSYPSIKGHPLPKVTIFPGLPDPSKPNTLGRDPYLSASLRGADTLVHPDTKEEVYTPSGYALQDFLREVTTAAGRRLNVNAIILGDGSTQSLDAAVINQRAFSTGDTFPVQVETTDPAHFIQFARERKIPYQVLGTKEGSSSRPQTPGKPAPPPVSTLCIFLEVGQITSSAVAVQFPGGHEALAVVPFNPTLHLEASSKTTRNR